MSKKLLNFSPFQWIWDETERVDFEQWRGSFVKNFIPHRYSHYCKIMHPIHKDLSITDKNLLWSQFSPDDEIVYGSRERISFKDLALNYNLKYTKEFSSRTIINLHGISGPRYLLFPAEGTLDGETLQALLPILQSFTTGSCYFQYDLVAVNSYSEKHGNGYLYYGDLGEVSALSESADHIGTPNYWWPENRDWCLHTNHDLDFTLFGGSIQMIQKLKDDDSLEIIEVDRETRVDPKADVKNESGNR
ncbi:hypothetical protein D3H55_10540 [Bacillus salacetis]|uniref:DUF2716 domain-containing protein n=1 Tax=Bacillus salacetis TaxID=2315464 RepID=A0A3A1R212_9BACI|nr:hypothetical protein [Bacillus salacetis]RIW34025.1 hypothetical protein D3H55_10540 [Bacillus salacetis]